MTQRLAAGGGRISAAPTFSPFMPTTTGVSGDPFGLAMQYMTAPQPSNVAANPAIADALARQENFGGGGDVGPNAPNTQGMSPATLGQVSQAASVLGQLGVNPGVMGPVGFMGGLAATMGAQSTPQGVLGTVAAPAIGMAVPGPLGAVLGQSVAGLSQGKSASEVGKSVAVNAALSAINPLAPLATSIAQQISPTFNVAFNSVLDSLFGVPTQPAAPVSSAVISPPADFGGGGGGNMGIGGATGIGATAGTSANLGDPIGVGQGGLGLGLGGGQTGVSGSGFAANIGSGGGGGGSASAGDGGFGFGGVSAGDTGNLGFGGGSLGGMATEGGGASSGGGGGGGGKIICTLLYEKGFMPKSIYQADQNFGALLALSDPAAYDGYYRWAKHVVSWMEQDTVWGKFVTAVTRRIAMPWAYAMAAEMGVPVRSSLFGRALLHAGLPFCRFVSPAKQGGYVNGLS